MKHCPQCGAEYRAGFDECWDCQVQLEDGPPEAAEEVEGSPSFRQLSMVFRSGRRMDAELVRGRLDADGLQAWIWSTGLGAYRMESAFTEITGVPNDFNAHQVMVEPDDEARALEILEELGTPAGIDGPASDVPDPDLPAPWLGVLRKRWLLLAFAFVFLIIVLMIGPSSSALT